MSEEISPGEIEDLRARNRDLGARVQELQDALEAIRSGEVDAIVVAKGGSSRIYTLEGPDSPYRALVESIREGALTLSAEGMILYANARFASMIGMPPDKIPGTSLLDHVSPEDQPAFQASFRSLPGGPCKGKLNLRLGSGALPVSISMSPLTGDPGSRISVIVVDRKEDADSLRESEVRYRTVADNTYDWEFWLDPEERFIYCSPSCERISGWKADDFFADPGLRRRIIHPDDLAGFERHTEEIEHRERVGEGRWRLLRPDGTICWVDHVCQPVYGEKGEFLGTRGSTRDITEAMKAEEALRESEERYRVLVDSAPMAILVHHHGKVLYANQIALELYGASSPEELMAQDILRLIPSEELAIAADRVEAIDEGKRLPLREGAIIRLDGKRVPIEVVSSPVRYGGFLAAQALMRDISDRKRAELELERMRVILSEGQKIAHVGSFEYMADTHETVWSEEEFRIYGLDPQKRSPSYEELLERHIHPDDVALLNGTFGRALQEGSVYELEHRIVRPDGAVRFVHDLARPYYDDQGNLVKYIGATLDITERKRARERITHLASFPELNPNPVIELNPSGDVMYANPATARTLGDLGLGNDPHAFLPGDFPVMLPRLLEGDVVEEVEVGDRVFLETITLNPSTRTTRVYARDITGRKRAEQVLRETSQYLENLINYANAPIIVWDPQFRITRFNQAFERLTGRTAEEVVGKGLEILFPPETVEGSMGHIRRAMTGERWEVVEIPILNRDGSIRTVLWNSATLYEADGKTVSSAIAQGQDITERKQAEDALRDTGEYLEKLINYANAPIIVWDREFRITRFNQAFEHLTGRAAAGVLGKPLEILFPPEHIEASMDLIRKTMGGERWESVEIPVLGREGETKTVLWNSAPLYEADGKTVSSAIAQGLDITDRKRMVEEIAKNAAELAEANAELKVEITHRKEAEVAVRNALSTLNAALESTADAMLIVNPSGRITGYNRNFITLWNMPESVLTTLDTRAAIEFVAGQTKDPDAFQARIREIGNHPARESYDMLELLDGKIIERYSKPQRIGNSIVGRVYSFRDITERKRAELQLIESLNEKEVLLREIHHRVKNNLQLTTSLLDMTRMRTTDPGTGGILTDIMMKIQTMAQIHTRLYESKQFDRIDMTGQVRDQVRALSSIYGGGGRDITVEIDSPALYLTLDQAIPCALALNEILSNAYKHAFKGRKSGTVKYSAGEEDGHVLFTVSDTGIGLPEGFDLARANTLGLKLVRTLVEQQLKGTLQVKGRKGTIVTIKIPKLREKEEEHV
jgi:PAS domain S-box-containing protein